jgi:alpha-beta hydrolase superfamily lysophospholipase
MTQTLPAVRDGQPPTARRDPAGSELAALAELAAEGFAGGVTRIQELHHAVAQRSFGPTGPLAAVPRAAHDSIAASLYEAVRGAGLALGGGLARGVRAAGGGPRISDHPGGRLVQGALNGVWGDRLEQASNALTVPMAVRVRGRDVAVDRASLAVAFPEATARPVVFVHGLCESDAAWSIRAAQHGGTYATRVLPDVAGTPVLLRYNSGLHISDNGRRLDALLEALVDAWPVPIDDLVLVGHSMGGLVARSAGHAATEHEHRWPSLVRTTVSLGTPHLGAPLERAAAMATRALHALPESRPIAALLAARSAGIKDLRHGSLVDAEWETLDPDAVRGFERAEVPLLPGARHHVVAATLTASPDHPVGRVLGDLLVLSPSAHGLQGRRRVIAFEVDDCRHVGGHTHFDLLNSPELDALLREWLSARRPSAALLP